MSIEYVESLEQSVVLLKLVIAEMSRHDAPFNPVSFAVWYEHLAGINPRLSQAVEQAKQAQPRLGWDAIRLLHREYVADADGAAAENARGELQRLMGAVAQSAAQTGTSARAYGKSLADLSEALLEEEAAAGAAMLTPRLSEVADSTAQMEQIVEALGRKMLDGVKEVEQLRQALERARIESVTDGLSKLRNRKGFDEALMDTLEARRATGSVPCLVVFDIDHFKLVNDTHGHPVGDAVIEAVGQILNRVTSSPGSMAARIGGEEFAVLMQSASVAKAQQLAETVRSLVRAMKVKKRGNQDSIATVTISAGIVAWTPGDDAASLLASADAALYRAKQAGRDCVVVA